MAKELYDFYNSIQWRKKRSAILRRDKYQCQECKKYGKLIPAAVVHHIQPLEDYPELRLVDSNLISLCNACHNKQHKEKANNLNYMRYR